mmetsp:Transcript_21582/g.53348  ORF Transcript_21582/g.53348 Transcript_21582/m.53348 type:complete len:332 (-) Transcript_21582:79-1074(-)
MRLHHRATIGIIKSAVSRQWRAARSHSQIILRGAGGWVRGELFSLEKLLKLRDCLRQKNEEAVSQRLGVGLHLGERRSSPDGVQDTKDSPHPAGVADLAVHDVPHRQLRALPRLVEHHARRLGRGLHLYAGGLDRPGQRTRVGAHELGDVPHAVGLEGIHTERITVSLGVWKPLAELEAGKGLKEFVLGERPHHRRDELKVGGEAAMVGETSGQNALGQCDERLRSNWEGAGCSHGSLVEHVVCVPLLVVRRGSHGVNLFGVRGGPIHWLGDGVHKAGAATAAHLQGAGCRGTDPCACVVCGATMGGEGGRGDAEGPRPDHRAVGDDPRRG